MGRKHIVTQTTSFYNMMRGEKDFSMLNVSGSGGRVGEAGDLVRFCFCQKQTCHIAVGKDSAKLDSFVL